VKDANIYLKKDFGRPKDGPLDVARIARDGASERSPQYFYRNANITPPSTSRDDLEAYLSTSKRKHSEEERGFEGSDLNVDSELRKSRMLRERQERQKRKERIRDVRSRESGVPLDPQLSTFSSSLPYSSPFIPLANTASAQAAATLSTSQPIGSSTDRKRQAWASSNTLPGEVGTLTPTPITSETSAQAQAIIQSNRFVIGRWFE
jgi:hypothetical protein